MKLPMILIKLGSIFIGLGKKQAFMFWYIKPFHRNVPFTFFVSNRYKQIVVCKLLALASKNLNKGYILDQHISIQK